MPILESSTVITAAAGINFPHHFDITGYSIDSRTIAKGNVFIGVKGENFDGSQFAKEAIQNGAVIAIVDEESAPDVKDPNIIKVKSALDVLIKIAKFKRAISPAQFVAVTGSVGKTTTKELLRCAIASQRDVYASYGNFNNHWGLPLCLANMPMKTQIAVFELGMNHAGEMAYLSGILRPDIAIITTVETVHLEFFNSIEDIARAKGEIFDGMKAQGNAVLNMDNHQYRLLREIAKFKGLAITSFGEDVNADYRLEKYIHKDKYCIVESSELQYKLPITGKHNALNSLAVLSCLKLLGLDLKKAFSYVYKNFAPPKGRGERFINENGIEVIDEAYNASPVAVKAALKNYSEQKDGKRYVAVLGDMRELGEASPSLHVSLLETILESGVDVLYLLGEQMENLKVAVGDKLPVFHTLSIDELNDKLKQELVANDFVLVKGSKSMNLYKTIEVLKSNG